jgi:SSS family solute:Na+ symporter
LVIAGFLSAVMSSLSAAFNSIAALYTIDFYKPKHPDASDRTLVLVGRLATIITVFIVILLVPFVKIVNSQIYIFLQSTQAFVSAPITAVFVFGLTLKKINAKSVLISLIVGECLGGLRFLIEFLNKSGMLSSPLLTFYAEINYLHFTIFLFLITSFLLFSLSYLVNYGSERSYSKIIFPFRQKQFEEIETKGEFRISRVRISIVLSSIVLILTFSLWYIFV